MKEQKRWEMWSTPYIPLYEIEKLFRFIRSWDRFFQGEPRIFQKIFSEIFPIIEKMKHERIENADFNNNELKNAIKEIFDKTANCTSIGRYESTDASKILHTILPHFFVMWDDAIKNALVKGKNDGETYAFEFLPIIKKELKEAIQTCMTERNLDTNESIKYIREQTGYQTLAKLADEYNYMKYTMKHTFSQDTKNRNRVDQTPWKYHSWVQEKERVNEARRAGLMGADRASTW